MFECLIGVEYVTMYNIIFCNLLSEVRLQPQFLSGGDTQAVAER